MSNAIFLAALSLGAASLTLSAQTASAPSAGEIAAALQQKYDTIRDFSADFTHNYEGGVLRKKVSERGTVLIKKPGRMRWNYTNPEQKVFVSDGRQIYLYVPADNQVMVTPVPEQDEATTAVLFLAGKGNLTRDFTVSFVPGGPPDHHKLRLEPKQPERDYDWLEVEVSKSTLQISALHAGDRQGGRSSFQFTNFKENLGLSDKLFEFKIPRGAEVIRSGPTAR